MDLLDRVATIGSSLSSNLDALSEQERQKYREFLESELKKLDQASARKSGNEKVRVD
jgi:hypothetical protein